jgi:DNA repair protein RecN (Recombination protein N)
MSQYKFAPQSLAWYNLSAVWFTLGCFCPRLAARHVAPLCSLNVLLGVEETLISELTVTNFAIIDKLHLRFAPGFNVLTGETGAGKSIIIDTVSALLGGRVGAEEVRAGADRAQVEGLFLLEPPMQVALKPLLQENSLEGDDDEALILAREIRATGRTTARVNGRAVTVRLLRQIGEHLVDIHGQSEHLSLLRTREHLGLLDRYAGLEAQRQVVAEKVHELRQVRQELALLLRDERELARRADLLAFQVQEIAAARLQVGEEVELTQERTRLANAERIAALIAEATQALYEGTEEQLSVSDLLGNVYRNLTELTQIDAALASHRQATEALTAQAEELARDLRAYLERIEFNPARLQEVEERLDLIYRLKRKYGDSIAEVLVFAEGAARELETITHSEERVEELQACEEALLREIGTLAADLSRQRREAADRLATAIEIELDDLQMAHTRFSVAFEQTDTPDGAFVGDRRLAFDATGVDRVEFLISPNPGEPLKSLTRIASGGETSRLMLALKTVLSQADETPTLIFDEIDQGIGGRVGGVVGRKLWGLTASNAAASSGHQVLCITHLPQLAGFGDTHFRVQKEVSGGRTATNVQPVTGEERVEELTSMLGAATESTRQSARDILAQVVRVKSEEA